MPTRHSWYLNTLQSIRDVLLWFVSRATFGLMQNEVSIDAESNGQPDYAISSVKSESTEDCTQLLTSWFLRLYLLFLLSRIDVTKLRIEKQYSH